MVISRINLQQRGFYQSKVDTYEHLNAKLRVTENWCILFNPSTYPLTFEMDSTELELTCNKKVIVGFEPHPSILQSLQQQA